MITVKCSGMTAKFKVNCKIKSYRTLQRRGRFLTALLLYVYRYAGDIMKKQDKKNFPDRKNYIKLLPAAAVIAALL